MGAKIKEIRAREVLDSRGIPTVEVDVVAGESLGRAIVPSGASTGIHEALELRDGNGRYRGKGVRSAIRHIDREIAPALIGRDVERQQEIDALLRELDGTHNKARLGANALLGVSLAAAHAAAAGKRLPLFRILNETFKEVLAATGAGSAAGLTQNPLSLPIPMVNIISGGLHAGGNLDLQDYLVIPLGAGSYGEALEMVTEVYWSTADVLQQRGLGSQLVADEGGHAPALSGNEQPLQVLVEAIERASYRPGEDVAIALDVASSHFYRDGRYHLSTEVSKDGAPSFTSSQMIGLLKDWVKRYPLISIEDGLAEDDWEGWHELSRSLGNDVQLIGDDLFTTNTERVRRGIEQSIANSVLVKVNQIGTLTETLETVAAALAAGYRPVISARSGETEDTTIADLAVGTGAGQIKIGSITRSERLAKYNQLLRIEEQLGGRDEAPFAGRAPFVGLARGR